jgi:hypothetical protein
MGEEKRLKYYIQRHVSWGEEKENKKKIEVTYIGLQERKNY